MLNRTLPAPSAEALMRSRYTAFCLKDLDYIWDTTDPETRPHFDRAANREWAEKAEFTRLQILHSTEKGAEGLVEFKAHFNMGGESHVHHEFSVFRREGGRWYFSEGRAG